MPPAFVTAAAESLFHGIAHARGTRALHPGGPLLAARASLEAGPWGAAREVEALVRTSTALRRGPGFDLHGLAVRLVDLHGPGDHQDLLLTSCPAPPLHVVLAPTKHPERAWFTSLLPYRAGDPGQRTIVVGRGLGDGRWAIGLCRPLRRDVRWLVRVAAPDGRVLEPDPAEAVAFDPMIYAGEDLHPDAGPIDAVREAAYEGSRAGRAG